MILLAVSFSYEVLYEQLNISNWADFWNDVDTLLNHKNYSKVLYKTQYTNFNNRA